MQQVHPQSQHGGPYGSVQGDPHSGAYPQYDASGNGSYRGENGVAGPASPQGFDQPYQTQGGGILGFSNPSYQPYSPGAEIHESPQQRQPTQQLYAYLPPQVSLRT